jgi:hypothetical protein
VAFFCCLAERPLALREALRWLEVESVQPRRTRPFVAMSFLHQWSAYDGDKVERSKRAASVSMFGMCQSDVWWCVITFL